MKVDSIGGRTVLMIGPSPPGVGASDNVIGLSWNNESGTSPPLWPSFMKAVASVSTFAKSTLGVGITNYSGNFGGIADPKVRTGAQLVLTARDTGSNGIDSRYLFSWLGPGPVITITAAFKNHLLSNGAFDIRLDSGWQTIKVGVPAAKLNALTWNVAIPMSFSYSGVGGAQPGTIDVARFVVEIYK